MALGVLNNLSAIYAENNLNNTNASLQSVLQQLSSGSRINSGSDDAAGLSLVNGLAANARALTQSSTNATEGVGLLQVADGALSQITNLLNRAVTLATEASNGTLNGSQSAAANQEYQSILSEINNIGSTTTYNQNQVFTGDLHGVAIYTGDSSASGSAINSLYFAKLSASSIGDVGGTVEQSSQGQFIDLSNDTSGAVTKKAALSDRLLAAGQVQFVVTNANAKGTPSTPSITVPTGGETIADFIAAINAAQIPGVTATFTTAGAVGNQSTGAIDAADTGIQLSNTNGNVSISISSALTDSDSGAAATSTLHLNNAATPTISYVFASGGDTSVSLSSTDLLNQDDAKLALTALNQAVSAVSSQDGYLGAEINTLNSISQVMATQQENVTSAQNAIQATDYAAATSNMSKYEILNQTGIAALAQANSTQQEVLKLLQ